MKHLTKLTLVLLASIAGTMQATTIYLSSITNQTKHQVSWEKLPLPGLLDKMRPQTIDRSDEAKPNMQLIPPATFQFQNPRNEKQVVLLEITLFRRLLKRRARTPQEAQKYRTSTMRIALKTTDGTILNGWSQPLEQNKVYNLHINLMGRDFKKSEVTIMSHEMPLAMGPHQQNSLNSPLN